MRTGGYGDIVRTVASSPGPVLTITALTPADATELVAGTDGEMRRWLNLAESTVDEVAGALASADPLVTNLGIRLEGRLAGLIAYQAGQPGMAPHCVNLAYALFPEARGCGIGTKAVATVGDMLHAQGDRVVLKIAPDNHRSRALAWRVGCRPLGRVTTVTGTEIWHVWRRSPAATREPCERPPADVQ